MDKIGNIFINDLIDHNGNFLNHETEISILQSILLNSMV